jgi:hypothetical protein
MSTKETKIIEKRNCITERKTLKETTCKHGRIKKKCGTCRHYCEHNIARSNCRPCNGSSFCSHGRRKYSCTICNGSAVCCHKRQRTKCKICGGGSLCSHGKQKSLCKSCNGLGICPHKKVRNKCKICKGSSYCIHNRIRGDCITCGGKNICVHKKRKYLCKECHGKGMCLHNRRKNRCKECGNASQICEHSRDKSKCHECMSAEKIIKSGRFCINCLSAGLSLPRLRSRINVCAGCDASVPERFEKIVKPMFLSAIPFPSSASDDTMIGGVSCDSNKRRPDLCWISKEKIVFLEIDEHGHDDRDPSCEVAKVIDQMLSVKKTYPGAVVAHFRFNPCEFDHRNVNLDERISQTAEDIKSFIIDDQFPWRAEVPYLLYYFYPKKSFHQIHYVFQKAADAINVLYVDEDNHFQQASGFVDIDKSWCKKQNEKKRKHMS